MSHGQKFNLKQFIKLYSECTASQLSTREFIDKRAQSGVSIAENHSKCLIEIMKHEPLLEDIVQNFRKVNFLGFEKSENMMALAYCILFIQNQDELEGILDSFWMLRISYLEKFLETICNPNYHFEICRWSCRLFADEYVLEKILQPLLDKLPCLNNLLNKYKNSKRDKKLTKPIGFVGLTRGMKKPPPPPANTPVTINGFRASRVPKSNWLPEIQIEKNLQRMREENAVKAKKLLEQSKRVSSRLLEEKKVPLEVDSSEDYKPVERKLVPNFKEVKIANTLTTALREATRVLKQREDVEKTLNNLLSGGCNDEMIHKIEQELREEEQKKNIETIERNHLKGLLSYESAILAKKNLLDENKEKYEKFVIERVTFLEALEQWKEEEQEKIKKLVEKSQNIKSGARESEKKILETKQAQVRLQQYETKQLLAQSYADKMKELSKKVELIKEIKTLHQIKRQVKKFDPTEAPNFGLLCEMSIAELQERLTLVKLNMRRELEEKRSNIQRRKEAKREMIENINSIIAEARSMPKSKAISGSQAKLEESPDIAKLRKQLEEKRIIRKALCS